MIKTSLMVCFLFCTTFLMKENYCNRLNEGYGISESSSLISNISGSVMLINQFKQVFLLSELH